MRTAPYHEIKLDGGLTEVRVCFLQELHLVLVALVSGPGLRSQQLIRMAPLIYACRVIFPFRYLSVITVFGNIKLLF